MLYMQVKEIKDKELSTLEQQLQHTMREMAFRLHPGAASWQTVLDTKLFLV
jgi:hypothetical protein